MKIYTSIEIFIDIVKVIAIAIANTIVNVIATANAIVNVIAIANDIVVQYLLGKTNCAFSWLV